MGRRQSPPRSNEKKGGKNLTEKVSLASQPQVKFRGPVKGEKANQSDSKNVYFQLQIRERKGITGGEGEKKIESVLTSAEMRK